MGSSPSEKEDQRPAAYDLWASGYDAQDNNPVPCLNDLAFTELTANTGMEGKTSVE